MGLYLVANIKGGVGKSTLAANLAGMCATAGKRVVLVDLDDIRVSSGWVGLRNRTAAAPVEWVRLDDEELARRRTKLSAELGRLREQFDVVIIDSGGHDSTVTRESIAAADHVIVPYRPGMQDLWGVAHTRTMILELQQAMGEPVHAVGVINAGNTQRHRKYEVVETQERMASDYADVIAPLATVIYDRAPVVRAMRQGLATVELPANRSNAASQQEFKSFYEEVFHEHYAPAAVVAA